MVTFTGSALTRTPPAPSSAATQQSSGTSANAGITRIVPIGSTGQYVVISNLPNGLAISSISTTGDYTQTNTCPATLTFGASCVISVTFTPSTSGSRPGTLTITDNASGSPHVIPLAGIGSPSGNPLGGGLGLANRRS